MPIPYRFVRTWMTLLTLVVFVLVILIGMTSMDYNVLASLTKQQSSQTTIIDGNTVQQSSTQSSNNTTNSIVSSSRITSSVSDDGLIVDLHMSGKIASSQVNLTNGSIEAVLFGNWSLDSGNGAMTNFDANFTRVPLGNNSANATEYEMGNLRVHSVQQINNILVLDGRVDITSNGTTLENASAAIIIRDGILVIGFEKETRADSLFKDIPLIGFEE